MNFVILNGSPKGDKSVTLQYIKYIQKIYPNHELKVINISQQIRKIENNDKYLEFVTDNIRKSDAVVWATPVYFLLVPANYKRFVERTYPIYR